MHNHRNSSCIKFRTMGHAPGLAFLLKVIFGLRWVLSGDDEVHSSFLIFSFGFRHEVVTPVSDRSFYTRCNEKRV